ncbi:hypothetical protein VNO77_02402 [Canavalia gladiata]|uniref:Uncharacterized protein n=1 Tax=Canavalia gladiata TaxID=3824 RepID=A0AAN9R316_CANGL
MLTAKSICCTCLEEAYISLCWFSTSTASEILFQLCLIWKAGSRNQVQTMQQTLVFPVPVYVIDLAAETLDSLAATSKSIHNAVEVKTSVPAYASTAETPTEVVHSLSNHERMS